MDDSNEQIRHNRRTTISCTMIPMPPLSTDIALPIRGTEDTTLTPMHASRRVRSLVSDASHMISVLPSRIGIGGNIALRRSSWSSGFSTQSHTIEQCHWHNGDKLSETATSQKQQQISGNEDRNTNGDTHSGYSATPWESDSKASAVVCEVVEEEQGRQLMSVFQIPAYMVEDHIWDSYRPLCFSVGECLRSWMYVHSELGNIITHLCGLFIFLCLALLTGPIVVPLAVGKRAAGTSQASVADYAVIYAYIATVLFCLAASVTFHTLACHSQHKHFRSLRCDFIGILTLIVGSFVPIGYYGFLHSRGILIGYMTMFVVLGILGVAVSVLGHVEDPRHAAWRPVIFAGIAGAGLVPIVHAAVLNGYADAVDRMSLWYVIGMCALYIVGTVIYAFKIPERYRPGKHDVLFHSHQIFHVSVVLAALLHYFGIVRALTWAHAVVY
ncbi:HlyIII-domain-containing protein [Coemansia reversa NRRL 1564]|uniref:HlyIII-domain-containing protein n=1 Tax=Coemansia reversa (strain ATCC 12441 / NRRL 1564) TaxID=763665 RepID=A0A2G5B2Y2_COERN|nr:HlyIII-domain-containing protein [Coemansia reversa NRRL 1564]|eukprot:PIA13382.1 HlyIII-domain-containing protein [Coemansia reversa NRRL 1564]